MPPTTPTSYRPRNPGHDYYGRGIYLVTVVVRNRAALLSTLGNDTLHPAVLLSPLGEIVQQTWTQLPEKQAKHGNHIRVHASVCMPDHFHGVIEALEPMQWSLGDILQIFKAVCTSRWQQRQGLPYSVNRPVSVDCKDPAVPT